MVVGRAAVVAMAGGTAVVAVEDVACCVAVC